MCKQYGKFPESLVALYMSQTLQGLLYLHEQGVIHRDIKGANILTTKDGVVKLADFGVATRTAGLQQSAVVGTPYWMAPEVIELSGATTASDVWSVGCTVVELLDGKPPYGSLQPMSALFHIVHDEHPPLPESVSAVSTILCVLYGELMIPSGRHRLLNAMLSEGPQSSYFCEEAVATSLDTICAASRCCSTSKTHQV